jgi:hypothetical protein
MVISVAEDPPTCCANRFSTAAGYNVLTVCGAQGAGFRLLGVSTIRIAGESRLLSVRLNKDRLPTQCSE